MTQPLVESWIFPVALVKGLLMAAVIIGIVSPSFLEALAVAACSAIITGVFLVISTHMQQRKTVEKVQEVADKVQTVQASVDEEGKRHGAN